ncbi:hypothetical protein [Streptomyces glaucescens]|uniref:hypothetical protein n=1 Tax=Streptomyces glaucescens TaxID=1907 RepID=UPI00117C248F|nr:hypothetical protein [Streptomyces glaucescens]
MLAALRPALAVPASAGHFLISADEISHETEIVWLEDIDALDTERSEGGPPSKAMHELGITLPL